jgi:hypothetical protein
MHVTLRKSHRFAQKVAALSIVVILAVAVTPCVSAQTSTVDVAVERDQLRVARSAYVAKNMQLSAEEELAFWPLYREYRSAVDLVVEDLLKVILKYADVYPNVPADKAQPLLKDYLACEQRLLDMRVAYLEKFARALTPARALLLAQLESRLDLVLRQQLADVIPLIPTPAKGAENRTKKGAE